MDQPHMGIVSGIIIFFCIWWIVLFMVLPMGVKLEEKPRLGHAESAPRHPNLRKKARLTTEISIAVWLVVFFIIQTGVLNFLLEY